MIIIIYDFSIHKLIEIVKFNEFISSTIKATYKYSIHVTKISSVSCTLNELYLQDLEKKGFQCKFMQGVSILWLHSTLILSMLVDKMIDNNSLYQICQCLMSGSVSFSKLKFVFYTDYDKQFSDIIKQVKMKYGVTYVIELIYVSHTLVILQHDYYCRYNLFLITGNFKPNFKYPLIFCLNILMA